MSDAAKKLTIFYDGSCPLCTSELGVYERADTDNALVLVDVSSASFSGDEFINRSDAMARLHVRFDDGRQVSGAQSFVEIWRVLPSWRWMAKVESIPGAVPMLEMLYRLFLRARPCVVRGFKRFQGTFGKSDPC
ncbi:thiol-disulfide oxidoreductase DCC family protein [Shimia litoralis]|uniref:thiol-disulfide oxidoreductase DCC family protein n=1 Tax=Shimia litoralis TaxID=420403 RepID=UPI001BB282B0|nr:DUF393 domain-containing protein [Shimia litoralis]